MNIKIYTDGSSKGNPGPGGWAAVIIYKDSIYEIGGRVEQTTNNKMELTAAIEALKRVKETNKNIDIIEIFSDSEYLIKGITMWIWGWMKNNWRTKNKEGVLNQDLWEALYFETKDIKIKWEKVLGHSGHKLNDRCDEIATSFADNKKIDLYKGLASQYTFLK